MEYVDEENNEDLLISYDQVFHAFIENNVIDTEHFYASDATALEESVGQRFNTYRDGVMAQMESILNPDNFVPQNTLSEEYDRYCNYIIHMGPG